jgi:uncharacterized protein YgbK (DUF1537 family)
MSSLAVVIIADDLTGALDSSAPFAALGMRCIATLAPAHLAAAMAKAPQVLAVNLGSRELPPEHAEGQVTQAVHALRRFVGPDTIWLKKIDSRLKGPVAVETNAVARALGIGRVLLCPAIPELGRVVRQGKVDGAGIVKAIKIDVRLPTDLQISIPDAETDADLDRVLGATGPGWLMVGARGLAGAIARSLCKDRLPEPAKLPTGPLGFVIGSRDPITLAQIAALRAAVGPRWIAAPDGQVPHLKAKGSMLMQATPGPGADGKTVSMRLAQGALAYLPGLCAVVAGGGETVAALLARAGVGLLHVQGEVLPGLPQCRAFDVPDFPALVTKSGGFGTPDTLLRLWQTSTQALDTHPCT